MCLSLAVVVVVEVAIVVVVAAVAMSRHPATRSWRETSTPSSLVLEVQVVAQAPRPMAVREIYRVSPEVVLA